MFLSMCMEQKYCLFVVIVLLFFCIQVVRKLCLGLQVENGVNNKFALFEVKGNISKVIDDRTILVDILGKFEM